MYESVLMVPELSLPVHSPALVQTSVSCTHTPYSCGAQSREQGDVSCKLWSGEKS